MSVPTMIHIGLSMKNNDIPMRLQCEVMKGGLLK